MGDAYYHPDTSPEPYVAHVTFSTTHSKCIKVQAGDGFSVFLTEKGDVFTFGMGNYGRLGHSHGISLSKPTVIDYFLKHKIKVVDISVGGRHSFAVTDKNKLYTWGFGYYYQLGTNSQED